MTRAPDGQGHQRVALYIDKLRRENGSLPGKLVANGEVRIDWRHLTKVLDYTSESSLASGRAGQLLLDSGLLHNMSRDKIALRVASANA